VVVIENGIDIDVVRATPLAADVREGRPEHIHVGIVGRLEPVKRVDLFLEVARELLTRDPKRRWLFHVIGSGSLLPDLFNIARRLEIDAHVRFHGHRSDSVACIKALDLLVICSDHEGLPMTSLEALATATPVVAHAVGGLNDVLANEAGGILVRDHSKVGYSDAIFRLLQSDASRFTTAGQSHLLARFSAETNAVRTLRLYRDELERDSVRKLR
jgi:glycosyltransferase involved in cell wall biosynthesis